MEPAGRPRERETSKRTHVRDRVMDPKMEDGLPYRGWSDMPGADRKDGRMMRHGTAASPGTRHDGTGMSR